MSADVVLPDGAIDARRVKFFGPHDAARLQFFSRVVCHLPAHRRGQERENEAVETNNPEKPIHRNALNEVSTDRSACERLDTCRLLQNRHFVIEQCQCIRNRNFIIVI